MCLGLVFNMNSRNSSQEARECKERNKSQLHVWIIGVTAMNSGCGFEYTVTSGKHTDFQNCWLKGEDAESFIRVSYSLLVKVCP